MLTLEQIRDAARQRYFISSDLKTTSSDDPRSYFKLFQCVWGAQTVSWNLETVLQAYKIYCRNEISKEDTQLLRKIEIIKDTLEAFSLRRVSSVHLNCIQEIRSFVAGKERVLQVKDEERRRKKGELIESLLSKPLAHWKFIRDFPAALSAILNDLRRENYLFMPSDQSIESNTKDVIEEIGRIFSSSCLESTGVVPKGRLIPVVDTPVVYNASPSLLETINQCFFVTIIHKKANKGKVYIFPLHKRKINRGLPNMRVIGEGTYKRVYKGFEISSDRGALRTRKVVLMENKCKSSNEMDLSASLNKYQFFFRCWPKQKNEILPPPLFLNTKHISPYHKVYIQEAKEGDMDSFIFAFKQNRFLYPLHQLLFPESMLSLIDGIEKISAYQVAHADIKPSNLLFEKGEHGIKIFITDFDLVSEYRVRSIWRKACVDTCEISDVFARRGIIWPSMDVYSLLLVMLQMVSSAHPRSLIEILYKERGVEGITSITKYQLNNAFLQNINALFQDTAKEEAGKIASQLINEDYNRGEHDKKLFSFIEAIYRVYSYFYLAIQEQKTLLLQLEEPENMKILQDLANSRDRKRVSSELKNLFQSFYPHYLTSFVLKRTMSEIYRLAHSTGL